MLPARFTKWLRLAGAASLVLFASLNIVAQEDPTVVSDANHAGSFSELLDKRRALLVVFKSRVISVENRDRAVIEDVLKADPHPTGRYRWVYSQIANKLNKYINKYQSLSAAGGIADADYVIYFNVVEFRRILNAYYPYGELFVIVKGSPQELKPPRIVWRAKKVMVSTDAIRDFIKDLKALRGEG
ncbi:MAG TPA: hypothetical protein VFS77_13870 [Pyrinomonadaceae bacterium]|nr:hypothetical protein [Pyrinomonadaceae bacterium]